MTIIGIDFNAGVKKAPAKKTDAVANLYDGALFWYADGTPRESWDTWVHPEYWAERELGDSITRPCEDRAFKNIFLQAGALIRLNSFRSELTEIEYEALTLEQACRRDRPHLHGGEVYAWVASQMQGYRGEWTALRVEVLLDEVTEVIQHAQIERLAEALDAQRGALADLKREAAARVTSLEQIAGEMLRAA